MAVTPGALELMTEYGIDGNELLRRHQAGDWGDMGVEDWLANDRGLLAGMP